MSRRLGFASLFALMLATNAAHSDDRRHWPLWPSEVQRVSEPLYAPLRLIPDSRRVAAVRALDRFATPLVAPLFIELLVERSNPVRREVLQACLERQIVACAPGARQIWRTEIMEPSLRIPALRVLALEASPDRLEIFLAALRDPDEAIRAEAARTIAAVTWSKEHIVSVRSNLIAKLADPSPAVRRSAAYGIGMLGPGDGALALSRLLTDPDPQVRQDIADALARLRDPRAAPALLRALQAGDETFVSRSYLNAFAALPGPDTDVELLRLLDAPPRTLTHRTVSEAIARRPGASPTLAEGLVLRLREEALRGPVLDALLGLGEAARPALLAALARGLEPPLELDVRRLLAALEPPPAPILLTPTWPEAHDGSAWQRVLADPDARTRLRGAAILGERSPAWLAGAAAWHLTRLEGPDLRRPWLLALATTSTWTATDPALLATLVNWSEERHLASGDRCLALAALARQRPSETSFRRSITTLAAANDAGMRACVASLLYDMSPRTSDTLLAGLLRDDSPRVRTAALHALSCRAALPSALVPVVDLLAARDSEPAVHLAVKLTRSRSARCDRWAALLLPEATTGGFVALRWRDHELLAPTETFGTVLLTWGPGLHDAEFTPRIRAPVEISPTTRILFD